MYRKVLVTGGVRSGKSRYAQELAGNISPTGRVLYIATAKVFDWEMEQRVKKHRASRPATWDTYEGHVDLGRVIEEHSQAYETILLDCITVMLTNLLFDRIGDQNPDTLSKDQVRDLEAMASEQADLLAEGIEKASCHVILVTNELGMGVVPERLLGRVFRDMAGVMNQKLADRLTETVFMVSGLPLFLKGGSR